MPSLPVITGLQAVAAFEVLGFSVVRIKGSHHMMKRDNHPSCLSVPCHSGKNIKKGTLRSLIRDSGHTVEEFIEALS